MEVVFWGAVHSECALSVDVCVHAHIALGTHRCVRVVMGCLGKEGRDPLMHLSRCNAPSAGLTREPRQPPADPGGSPCSCKPGGMVFSSWERWEVEAWEVRGLWNGGIHLSLELGLPFYSKDFVEGLSLPWRSGEYSGRWQEILLGGDHASSQGGGAGTPSCPSEPTSDARME